MTRLVNPYEGHGILIKNHEIGNLCEIWNSIEGKCHNFAIIDDVFSKIRHQSQNECKGCKEKFFSAYMKSKCGISNVGCCNCEFWYFGPKVANQDISLKLCKMCAYKIISDKPNYLPVICCCDECKIPSSWQPSESNKKRTSASLGLNLGVLSIGIGS